MNTIPRVPTTRFEQMFYLRWLQGQRVCVGLDPDPTRLPEPYRDKPASIKQFVLHLIEATTDHAGCYKLNFGAYLRFGAEGLESLEEIIAVIRRLGIPFILDCKLGDIGDSNVWYADFVLKYCEADAITWHPTLGRESFDRMLANGMYNDRTIFVLCRTSNKGGAEFQNRKVEVSWSAICERFKSGVLAPQVANLYTFGEELGWKMPHEKSNVPQEDQVCVVPSYQDVALQVSEWGDNFAIVVGATAPEELQLVRRLVPKTLFLIPGVGKQGGKADFAAEHGCNEAGIAIINVSSDICQPKADSPLYVVGEPHFTGVERRVKFYNDEIAKGLARRRTA